MTASALSAQSGPLSVDPDMLTVATNIEQYGIHLMHIGESCDCGMCTAPPLSRKDMYGYTVGLSELGHPELLLRGTGADETIDTLARWGSLVLEGEVLDAGHLLCEGREGTTWELLPVLRPTQSLLWAERFYRHSATVRLSALELIPARRRCPCHSCS